MRGRISLIVAAGALVVAGGVALLLKNTVALRSSADSTNRARRGGSLEVSHRDGGGEGSR